MKKSQKYCYLLLLISSLAYPITISEVVKKSKVYEGKSITIEGEVISKPMKRGNLYFVNISDGIITIGVFIDKTPKIKHYGGYSVIGDRIRVSGRFNAACREHWGKMDIHASSLEILEEGKVIKKIISRDRIFFLFALSLGCILLILIKRRYVRD